jgi:hypothetical protein
MKHGKLLSFTSQKDVGRKPLFRVSNSLVEWISVVGGVDDAEHWT